MLGMGVGFFAIIISISVMNGFENIVHGKLKGFEGDIRIYDNTKDVIWKNLEGIESVMPFMERKVVLQNADNKRVVLIKAIDEEKMLSFYDFSLRGSVPKNGEIVIGQDLAYRLGIDIGDLLSVYSPIDQIVGLSSPFKRQFRL